MLHQQERGTRFTINGHRAVVARNKHLPHLEFRVYDTPNRPDMYHISRVVFWGQCSPVQASRSCKGCDTTEGTLHLNRYGLLCESCVPKCGNCNTPFYSGADGAHCDECEHG